MQRYKIIGAGMAGLFAAASLREECSHVIEAQPKIPNNHSALLRFRSSIVGDALNIPFEPVDVVKTVAGSLGNPVADAVSYSVKTTGTARLRSILSASGAVERRYIAPPDFIERMRAKATASLHLGQPWVPNVNRRDEEITISTLPMPVLMLITGYKDYVSEEEFKEVRGYNISIDLANTDLCATIYFPSLAFKQYRASITKNKLIIEHARPAESSEQVKNEIAQYAEDTDLVFYDMFRILSYFGIPKQFIRGNPSISAQRFAKILPIDEEERRRFILWASETHGIYSFGRFATWRPGLLLDDLVNDLRVIQRLANGKSSYSHRKG